jgi:hypothetical protein
MAGDAELTLSNLTSIDNDRPCQGMSMDVRLERVSSAIPAMVQPGCLPNPDAQARLVINMHDTQNLMDRGCELAGSTGWQQPQQRKDNAFSQLLTN